MLPVLIQFGDTLKLHTYGLMIFLGFIVGLNLAQRYARQIGEDDERIADMGFWLLAWGLVGARTLFIIVNWSTYSSDPLKIFKIWEGGLVFYGGFLGALGYFLWAVRAHRLNPWLTGDIIIPSLALGHAFGRLGCFAAGCCWGRPVDHHLGANFPAASEALIGSGGATGSLAYQGMAANGEIPLAAAGGLLQHTPDLHPVQLYESFGELSLFFILVMWRNRKAFHGQILLAWLMLYPILRSVMETFRGDKARGVDLVLGMSTSQLISVLVAGSALILIIISWKNGKLGTSTNERNLEKIP
jgi:phosphatidylglycerol:prolipoprotein diacylglycerol transferase